MNTCRRAQSAPAGIMSCVAATRCLHLPLSGLKVAFSRKRQESAFSGLLSGIEIEIEIEIGMETLMPARHDEVDQFVEYLTIWRWREVVERLPRFVREDMRLGK